MDELVREPGDGGAGAAQNITWRRQLARVGFSYPDLLDRIIFDGAARGYFDEDAILTLAGELEVELKDMSRAESYSRAWDDYWGSFASDEAEVVERILEAARETLHAIDPPSLNAAVRLLRDLGRGEDASILIADYAAKRQCNLLGFTVGPASEFAKGNVDPELGTALEQIFAMPVDRRSALEVFQTIARENLWTSTDMTLLSCQTPIELEQIIEATSGPDLKKIVQITLSMMSSTDDEHAELRSKLRTALEAIFA